MHVVITTLLQSRLARRLALAGLFAAPASAFAAIVVFVLIITAVTSQPGNPAAAIGAALGCRGYSGIVPPGEGPWDDEQRTHAATIVAVGRQLAVPAHGIVVALGTAMQESSLRNLDHGDAAGPDSRGLFQQRPSQGWGTREQILDPAYAAAAFYGGPGKPTPNAGLLDIAGWEAMPMWQAAQAVQRSANGPAYAKWEGPALALAAELADLDPTTACPPTVTGDLALPLPLDAMVVPAPAHHDYPAIDYAIPTGTPVYAVTGGTVTHVDGGYGLGIQITTPTGDVWIYGHNSIQLAPAGSTVQAGDQIALSGNTGRSTGPHLHLELRAPDGTKRCPHALIDALATGQPAPAVPSLPTSGCSY